MSALDAQLETSRAPAAPDSAVADAIEAEVYLTLKEYALVLHVTERWLEDHCGPRYDDVAHSRVGRHLRFSPEDRAENRRRFAVWPAAPDASEAPSGISALPTDPVELAKVLANVRRVMAPA